MNWRLLRRCFAVWRNRLILSANGRHYQADQGRAQKRNPKQIHFRLLDLRSGGTVHFRPMADILSAANGVNSEFRGWPEGRAE
jgi:hypothetical protein